MQKSMEQQIIAWSKASRILSTVTSSGLAGTNDQLQRNVYRGLLAGIVSGMGVRDNGMQLMSQW